VLNLLKERLIAARPIDYTDIILMSFAAVSLFPSFVDTLAVKAPDELGNDGVNNSGELGQQALFCLFDSWLHLPSLQYSHIQAPIERVLAVHPKNPIANAARAIGLIEKGHFVTARESAAVCLSFSTTELYTPSPQPAGANTTAASLSSNKIPVTVPGLFGKSEKTVCASVGLCVAMVVQSFAGFRDLAVSDTLRMTQEAVRRIISMSMSMSTDEKSNKQPLRGDLVELVSFARLAALARVSQYSIAIEESVNMFPAMFTPVATTVPKDPLDALLITAVATDLPSTASLPVKWMAVRFLSSVGMYEEVVRVCDSLLSSDNTIGSSADGQPATAQSWIIAEKGCALLQQLVSKVRQAQKDSGVCLSLLSSSLRDVQLSETDLSAVIRLLRSALTTGDDLVGEAGADVKLQMGLAMWLAGSESRLRKDKNGCIAFLLESAKLDPTGGGPYSFIGHYYYLELKDADRAAKCYLKALSVNPLDREAGLGLTTLYLETGQLEKAQKMWGDVTSLTSHAQWCFAVLGQYHVCAGNFEAAVPPLQHAVDLLSDDANSKCYANIVAEILADVRRRMN
jgi:tetratricopeptide (TPR) repeat protein